MAKKSISFGAILTSRKEQPQGSGGYAEDLMSRHKEVVDALEAGQVHAIPLKRIKPDPNQPRRNIPDERIQDLARSIETEGLLQPIKVRRDGDEFIVVYGETRYRAMLYLNKDSIPAQIDSVTDFEDPKSRGDLLIAQLAENVSRNDLLPFEIVESMKNAIDLLGITPAEAGARIGLSRSKASEIAFLMSASPEIRKLESDGISTDSRMLYNAAKLQESNPEAFRRALAEIYQARDEGGIVRPRDIIARVKQEEDEKAAGRSPIKKRGGDPKSEKKVPKKASGPIAFTAQSVAVRKSANTDAVTLSIRHAGGDATVTLPLATFFALKQALDDVEGSLEY